MITTEQVQQIFKNAMKDTNDVSINEFASRELGITVEELREIYARVGGNNIYEEIAQYVNNNSATIE